MKKIFITIIAACSILSLSAQDAMNRELTLEKEYNPGIRDANKINQLPELSAPEAPKTQVKYSDYTRPYSVSPYLIHYTPSAYFTDLAASNKIGYLNLGVSTSPNIDADLGVQILNTNRDYLSIYASNRYSNSKQAFLQNEDVDSKMKLHDIWGGLKYKHYFDAAIFNIGGQYNYSKYNYYGRPSDFLDYYTDDIDQTANFFRIYTGVQAVEGSDLFYKLNVAYTNFKYKHTNELMWEDGRRENRMIIDGVLQKQFNSTWKIGIDVSFKNYSYSDPEEKIYRYETPEGTIEPTPIVYSPWDNYDDYFLLSGTPYFQAEGTNWNVRIGLNPEYRFRNNSKFTLSPDIHLSYAPMEQFSLYINAAGGVKDNSLFSSFYENRYMSPEWRLRDSRSPLDGTLGIKITPVPGLMFDLFGGYKITKDEYFCYAPWGTKYYPLITDSDVTYIAVIPATIYSLYSDAKILKLGANIQYKYKDNFSIGLKGTYYKWDIDEDSGVDEPWGKPKFVMDGRINYNVGVIPLSVALNYHLEAGRPNYFNTDEDMDNINDLSLNANYAFNDSFSVYASLNNLLFQKYDIWYGYPAQNFNLMGGISLKF